MKKLWILALILTMGCDQLTRESEALLTPLETPPSYLSFRVDFPIKELELGVNRVLPQTLFDDAVALKDKDDTLFLKVRRKGNLKLNFRDGEAYASIPLDVDAAIKKKVMGITFSNEDTPVSFSGILRASASISLSDQWDMNVACQYQSFDLEGMDTFSFMGISFNVEKIINGVIDEHRDDLSNVICQAVRSSLDFRSVTAKVYADIQKPLRVAKNPQPLYLHTQANALNGKLMPVKRDTLSLHVEYRSKLILNTDKTPTEAQPLPVRKEPLNTDNKLLIYPDVQIGYNQLSQLLTEMLKNEPFSYERYTITIQSAKAKPNGQRLQIDLQVSGDVTGTVKVSGVPILNANQSMSLSDFQYEIDSDDDLLKMADWISHDFIEEYLSSQIQVDTKPFFDDLDELIVRGISNTPLNNKMDPSIQFDKIQTYQFRCTEDFIQWVFVIEGSASLQLKNGLFQN
ncbi:DUF4403 family protein [Marinoscillum sp.]|uniref:DUF4403 family protein n=1 Tax=Marinoscillum sp. TaxID=2024838 RepID=UPI003BAC5B02